MCPLALASLGHRNCRLAVSWCSMRRRSTTTLCVPEGAINIKTTHKLRIKLINRPPSFYEVGEHPSLCGDFWAFGARKMLCLKTTPCSLPSEGCAYLTWEGKDAA